MNMPDPWRTVEFVDSWTHGLNLTVLKGDRAMTPGSFLRDLFNVSLTGFVIGAPFAWSRNLMGRARAG